MTQPIQIHLDPDVVALRHKRLDAILAITAVLQDAIRRLDETSPLVQLNGDINYRGSGTALSVSGLASAYVSGSVTHTRTGRAKP